jgi:F-type H+-transporting ATPase subunit b
MKIDWITVSAQIVNFLILVWLLKHFLYEPVMRAMGRREQRIAQRLDEAQQREQDADKKVSEYNNKKEELDKTREDILTKAKQEVDKQKQQLLDVARNEVDEQRRHWQKQASQEKDEFIANLRRQITTAVESISRKAMRELADTELEAQIVNVFLERLQGLDTKARKAFAKVSMPMNITTSFELDSSIRGRLTRAIHENIADGVEVEYTQSPELLCGIELTGGGQRLSWNIEEYIDDLTAHIEEAFKQTAQDADED